MSLYIAFIAMCHSTVALLRLYCHISLYIAFIAMYHSIEPYFVRVVPHRKGIKDITFLLPIYLLAQAIIMSERNPISNVLRHDRTKTNQQMRVPKVSH